MTKTIALALVLALAGGCKDKKKDAPPVEPTPMPTTGSGSAATPTTGSGSATTPATAACEMKVELAGDGLTWKKTGGPEGGGMGDAIDTAKLTEAAKGLTAKGPCTGLISGEDKVVYRNVITAMDAMLAGGIEDIQLDMKGADSPDTGKSTDTDLKSMPVVAVTTDAVLVNSKEVGKLADAKLDAALATAFADARKATPDAGKIILQADKDTTWANLSRIVGAAKTAGFGDVLFAIKNQ